MAVYYYLAVACLDQDAAMAVTGHFNGLRLTLSDGLPIHCQAVSQPDWVGAWWSLTRPYGASLNAVALNGQPEPNLTTRAQRSEIGQRLYQHLRDAPAFRYARFGAEALDDFFDVHSTYNRVLRDPGLLQAGWDGLVIDQALWDLIGRSDHYQTFRPGYVWMPYRGEHQW